ncbi:hypothetical protein ACFQ1S_12245, partial [Kibdelosporangium lantanae]
VGGVLGALVAPALHRRLPPHVSIAGVFWLVTLLTPITIFVHSGYLMGAHIIGPQAPTVIQPLIQAMSFGLSAHEMARGQYWIHPGMPEVVENALLNLALD